MNRYKQKCFETARELMTSMEDGITSREAEKRLERYGENKLEEKKRTSLAVKFFSQFNDFMVIVLIAAAAVSFAVAFAEGKKDFFDPVIILLIVILNAVLGMIQENKAEKALEALKNMSSPAAKVIRDGKIKGVRTEMLVPGDLIIIETGDYIPADARLVSTASLKVEESALTGESVPSEKNEKAVFDKDMPIGDRVNMVFAGSSVTLGRGMAIVTETGMNTEMGKIASMIIQDDNKETPLQRKLAETGKILGLGAIIICLGIFFLGIIRNIPPFEMFMTSISLAVAAIPEGLPAIVTVMLAIGVQAMAKKNAVIRRLPAVETLGSATVICSDKTGTLTQNKMKVVEIYPENQKENILTLGVMCNDSDLGENSVILGEPTENAIVAAALGLGIDKNTVCGKMPRVGEIPFESERKLMTTVHRNPDGGYVIITKGAPDVLLKKCGYFYDGKKTVFLDKTSKNRILSENKKMAEKALRVLAVAFKSSSFGGKNPDKESAENDLIFAGLMGMIDPPRKETKEAVELCKRAGIKPVMITGDHILTASAIAKKIGIMDYGDKAITGEELSHISEETLCDNIFNYSVFARVSPEHKVRIVKAFKKRGAVVAMTGDGVNDAPALKAADIGCAMGISGTDVAKGAADMVLTDDNFATIIDAVRHGRGIYSNIKKAVHFLLSSNIGEIISILAAMLIGFRTPLLAVHLLWVNLVTDSLPAIALGLDPAGRDIMDGKPQECSKGLFSKGLWIRIGLEGMMIGMLALVAFGIGHVFFDVGEAVETGRTMAFATLSISQLVHAFNMRSEKSIFKINLFGNMYLVGSLIIGVILQAGVIMIEPLAKIFKVTPLSSVQWLIVAGLCIVPILVVEAEKLFQKNS